MRLSYLLPFAFVLTSCKPPVEPPPPPPPVVEASEFVNWETPPIHPLEITPDGQTLLVANIADHRLEVFTLEDTIPIQKASIPVGLDPVSVRARNNNEVWVVNHISDSISIVDLSLENVIETLPTGDEPADVLFAGTPERAFVSISQENKIQIFDPEDRSAPPLDIPIEGEDPRALTSDGENIYVAIFESGNLTTALNDREVSDPQTPYNGENPPPLFDEPFSPETPAPPAGLIVKRDEFGAWRDENGSDWSDFVTWDLHDHDVAIIPVNNPEEVSYISGLMNLNMSLTKMHDGKIAVVGSEALNHIRFEPRVNSQFVRMMIANFDPQNGVSNILDLNPHLDYQVTTIPQKEREQSISDPRAIVWSENEDLGYVSGMGTNNVIVVNAAGERLDRIKVGQGPTGLALDEIQNRLYVLNRFDATISVIDTNDNTETDVVAFFDSTPEAIRAGRPFLYDAHLTSGLGQASCGSCHIDARMDQLAWDLGDPEGLVKTFNQECQNGPCEDWHPIKGPMATQSLQGIVGTEPLHWRGDREDLAAFRGAFVGLLGDDQEPSDEDLQAFEDFLANVIYPPNPFRNFDGSLKITPLENGGIPQEGETLFLEGNFEGGPGLNCNTCHRVSSGTEGAIHSRFALEEPQSFKTAQLRNMYEKTGFDRNSLNNNRGFGFLHDGSDDSIFTFLNRDVFDFPQGKEGDTIIRHLEAFLFSFNIDTHAAVGVQLTVNAQNQNEPQVQTRLDEMITLAEEKTIGIIVKGVVGPEQRGAFYDEETDLFQTDRDQEALPLATLLSVIQPGNELTFTVVPFGTQIRMGVDRDQDGKFDNDEIDTGTNPLDPAN